MNIERKTIWQHSAGGWHHDHVDVCFDWDVILIGPGEQRWSEMNDESKNNQLIAFYSTMQSGDIVLLKLGLKCIYGVGIIGSYDWCDEFNDVDGWDLGHIRRVQWVWKSTTHNDDDPKVFESKPFTRNTTCRLGTGQDEVLRWLRELKVDTPIPVYKDLPKEVDKEHKLTNEDIAAYLFEIGIASDSIRNLFDEHGEFLKIANWYKGWKTLPSEHETVTHLVVPLLRMLGWTPQRMAIEWNKMDLALFSRLVHSDEGARNDNNLDVVVEAKKVWHACLLAKEQVESYAKERGNCSRLIVTDGLRYGVFLQKREKDDFELYAYLNLIRLRSEYPIYNCKGAKEALAAMTPEWRDGWQL